MSNDDTPSRRFFHSFPRPKKDESEDATLDRGLSILTLMKQVGLVLAPEVVIWDISAFSLGAKQLSILQRRVSFTELSVTELAEHSAIFGPISLSFDIAKLRGAGATPVIYVLQGTAGSPLSQVATFCVHGAHHTKYVLSQLHELKEVSDPARLAQRLMTPVSPNCEITLRNTGPAGNVVAEYKVKALDVQHVLQYVGFNNIPFDHSSGILGFFLDMFYPADNTYKSDQLGYYRQREWRLTASNVNLNGRPIGRKLSSGEIAKLEKIDREFWRREIVVDGAEHRRSDLALVYDPMPGWDFFDLVEEIFAPQRATDRVRAIVGDRVTIHPRS
ncbi:MAG: hypothetical protein ABSE42_07210 [Bryobacteraceae bacterium]|jgi:hypothetical protein